MARLLVLLIGLVIGISALDSPAVAEMALAGAGSEHCDLVNSYAVPGRGIEQNTITKSVFEWSQGYMSGFNGYSMLIDRGSPFDLGAASLDTQWEFMVSYCRSHPTDFIIQAIQDMQVKLLLKK